MEIVRTYAGDGKTEFNIEGRDALQPPGAALQTAILGKQSRNLFGLRSGLDRGQTLTIFLDYVMFDDGQFIGPDVCKEFGLLSRICG